MSIRIITEDYLDRSNITERLDACMCVMQFVFLKFISQGSHVDYKIEITVLSSRLL
jgi:hypothetical protein